MCIRDRGGRARARAHRRHDGVAAWAGRARHPVSYTHLDVYKRQEQEFAREGEGLCRGLWLVPEERLPVRLGRTKLDYDGALGALTERVRCD